MKELESINKVLDSEKINKVNKYLLMAGQKHLVNVKGTTAAERLKQMDITKTFRITVDTKDPPKEKKRLNLSL